MATRRIGTRTGGRQATLRHIPGDFALAVGMPPNASPPQGWRWVALTDVAWMASGHTPSRRHPEFWDGDVPWIGIKDAKTHHGHVIHDTREHTNHLGLEKSSARLLPVGTVCLSRTASVGYVIIMGRPMATSQDFVNWECGDDLLPEYLKYLFLAEERALLRFASGAVHQTIYYPEAKALHVCIPPLPEQERIVAILDEAFAAITTAKANTEKNLANARELLKSKLSQVFDNLRPTGTEATLSELATHSLGKMLDKKKNRGEYLPYLRNLNVRWFDFNLSDIREMRFEASEHMKYTAEAGDLMICEGGYPGRAAIWKGRKPIHFQKAIHRVRFNEPRHTRWFLYYLYYLNATGEIRKYFTGAGIQHFTGKALARVSVPILPLGIIEAHVTGFETIRSEAAGLSKLYEKRIALVTELKQSILQKSFTGELTADPQAADRELSEAKV